VVVVVVHIIPEMTHRYIDRAIRGFKTVASTARIGDFLAASGD